MRKTIVMLLAMLALTLAYCPEGKTKSEIYGCYLWNENTCLDRNSEYFACDTDMQFCAWYLAEPEYYLSHGNSR